LDPKGDIPGILLMLGCKPTVLQFPESDRKMRLVTAEIYFFYAITKTGSLKSIYRFVSSRWR